MRSRLLLLVGSIAAFGAACGDNGTVTPDARRIIDAQPAIDATPELDSRPPVDARPPDAPPSVTIDARPNIDAAPLIDGPPTTACPGGNAPECNGTAGGICASNNDFALCVEYDTVNHCFEVMPMPCALHQSCTTPGARGDRENLCTCDGSECNGQTGHVCVNSNTGFVTCDSETNDGETCFFTVGGQTTCTPPRTCGLAPPATDEDCICPADAPQPVENGGCPTAGAGATSCGVDIAGKSSLLVCTIEPSGCRIWKVQLACDALQLTCNPATTACECNANDGAAVYANPVPAARDGFTGSVACQIEHDNCNPHPTGVREPSYCSFATLTEAIAEAGNAGTVVASRFVTSANADSPDPAVFEDETFPLNGAGGGALVLTTDDDPAVGGGGLSVVNADHFQIVFDNTSGPVAQAVELGADDAIRGFRISNSGLQGARAINCSGSGTGNRVDSVRIDSNDGGNVLGFGIVANGGCNGSLAHLAITGGGMGIFVVGPLTIDDATVTSAGFGIFVQNTATVNNSRVLGSQSTGISATVSLTATNTTVQGGTDCVLSGVGGVRGNIVWNGGAVRSCTGHGFGLSNGTAADLTVNGPTTIDGNGEGITVLANGTATLHGATISGSTSHGVNIVDNGTLTTNGAATTIMTSGGSGIQLASSGTANLTNTSVLSSGAAGVTVAGSSALTLGNNAAVSMSGTSGVVLTGGTVTTGAGSSITLNAGAPGHGIAASGGTVTLNPGSITANGGNGVDLSGAAVLTSTGSIITTNADGVHTTGTGAVSITGGVVGGAGTDQGNTAVGIHIEGTNAVTISNVTVNNNDSTGLLQTGGAATTASGSTFNTNGASGVVVTGGRAALSTGHVDGNTGGIPILNAPVAAGVAVGSGAAVTVAGSAPTAPFTVNGNGVGIFNVGNFAGVNVEVADNDILGVLAISADTPAFPTATGDATFVGAPVGIHNSWLRNFLVSGNGTAPGNALGLQPGGVTVFKSRAAPLAAGPATNFALLRDATIPNSVTFIHDNAGNGVTLGAPASGNLCSTLDDLPGVSCGSVDAIVQTTFIARNGLNGILIQGGGTNGLGASAHIVENRIYANKAQGVFARPSVYVSGQTVGPPDSRRFTANIIKGNVTAPPAGSNPAETGEIEFDATQFPGGPVPGMEFNFDIEDDVGASCNDANTFSAYNCPSLLKHKGVVGRNNSHVEVVRQRWMTTTPNNTDDWFTIQSTISSSFAACPPESSQALCELPTDP